jgi:hypothetical protein
LVLDDSARRLPEMARIFIVVSLVSMAGPWPERAYQAIGSAWSPYRTIS